MTAITLVGSDLKPQRYETETNGATALVIDNRAFVLARYGADGQPVFMERRTTVVERMRPAVGEDA